MGWPIPPPGPPAPGMAKPPNGCGPAGGAGALRHGGSALCGRLVREVHAEEASRRWLLRLRARGSAEEPLVGPVEASRGRRGGHGTGSLEASEVLGALEATVARGGRRGRLGALEATEIAGVRGV